MTGFRCLALETGVPAPSVAACNGDEQCELRLPGGRKAAAALFEAIDEVLARVKLAQANLDCIAFGRGPGSFTGLRVAASAAQGLGIGLNVKLCAVSSLAALAQEALDHGGLGKVPQGSWVAPCLSAGREQVYMGWYWTGEAGLVAAGAEDWLAPVEDCRVPGDERFIAAGGLWRQSSALQSAYAKRIVEVVEGAVPRARAVLRLARREYSEGRLVSPKQAQPVYLRNAV